MFGVICFFEMFNAIDNYVVSAERGHSERMSSEVNVDCWIRP